MESNQSLRSGISLRYIFSHLWGIRFSYIRMRKWSKYNSNQGGFVLPPESLSFINRELFKGRNFRFSQNFVGSDLRFQWFDNLANWLKVLVYGGDETRPLVRLLCCALVGFTRRYEELTWEWVKSSTEAMSVWNENHQSFLCMGERFFLRGFAI